MTKRRKKEPKEFFVFFLRYGGHKDIIEQSSLTANLPLAQACGMGLNVFFVFTACIGFGLTYANARRSCCSTASSSSC